MTSAKRSLSSNCTSFFCAPQSILQQFHTHSKVFSSLAKASSQERRGIYPQLRQLRKELWEREGKAVDEILSQANVILATNASAADKKLKGLIWHGWEGQLANLKRFVYG